MRMRPHLLGDNMHTHALGGTHTCWEAHVRVGGVRVRVGAHAYALGACIRVDKLRLWYGER
jgi:hypothetical protein